MSSLAEQLIPWQKQYGRHDLPWQNKRDPYAVWLSEIMLQQTQVGTVIPYYQRFIQKFPTIEILALAPIDDVLACWSGLGYYSRARHLHRAASLIMREHGGIFPQTREGMEQLPGIGRSTAAAVAVFAYGRQEAILDGNVKRVFARYFGINRYPNESETLKQLWCLAEESLPKSDSADGIRTYTQALMDLGATVCIRRKPVCNRCPLQRDCVAYSQKRVTELPVSRPTKPLPKKETIFMIYRSNGTFLLEKRVASGVWGGLWCFPEVSMDIDMMPVKQTQPVILPGLWHTFTHFKLLIHPYLLDVQRKTTPSTSVIWVNAEEALQLGIPVPVRKLIQQHLLA